MALVVFVVGAAASTSPEHALARYGCECLDLYGHTTLIAGAPIDGADAVVDVRRTELGFELRNLRIGDADLEIHGCGATLAPEADNALRHELADLSAVLDGSTATPDELVSADQALAMYDAGAVLLDVRSNGPHTPSIPGAIAVEKDRVLALGLSRDLRIVLFCNGERGSGRVLRVLRAHGYSDVRHVRGGISEMVGATQRRGYAHLG